jgi:cytochrome c556
MRFALFAATAACALLGACGGPESSEANNAQTNVGNEASQPANGMLMVAAASLNKDQALKIMHERHEGMEEVGKANKVLRRELTGSSPDLAAVRSAAAKIASLSAKASGWFPRGTGPELGKTGAKPEIWQNPQDFSAKLRNFQAASQTFTAAARSGDVGAIKGRYAELGQACKSCHDKYRSEMHH